MTSSQKGVVRTNCIDCLDRSNYVQSLLGKIALLSFIDDQSNRQHLNFPLESLEFGELETAFKSLWKRNAAAIARLSTGASAMKMDFYERGRRTFYGKIRDFGVGAKRYYIGLFADYYYQVPVSQLRIYSTCISRNWTWRPPRTSKAVGGNPWVSSLQWQQYTIDIFRWQERPLGSIVW